MEKEEERKVLHCLFFPATCASEEEWVSYYKTKQIRYKDIYFYGNFHLILFYWLLIICSINSSAYKSVATGFMSQQLQPKKSKELINMCTFSETSLHSTPWSLLSSSVSRDVFLVFYYTHSCWAPGMHFWCSWRGFVSLWRSVWYSLASTWERVETWGLKRRFPYGCGWALKSDIETYKKT